MKLQHQASSTDTAVRRQLASRQQYIKQYEMHGSIPRGGGPRRGAARAGTHPVRPDGAAMPLTLTKLACAP